MKASISWEGPRKQKQSFIVTFPGFDPSWYKTASNLIDNAIQQ